jgi:hypothetical protein
MNAGAGKCVVWSTVLARMAFHSWPKSVSSDDQITDTLVKFRQATDEHERRLTWHGNVKADPSATINDRRECDRLVRSSQEYRDIAFRRLRSALTGILPYGNSDIISVCAQHIKPGEFVNELFGYGHYHCIDALGASFQFVLMPPRLKDIRKASMTTFRRLMARELVLLGDTILSEEQFMCLYNAPGRVRWGQKACRFRSTLCYPFRFEDRDAFPQLPDAVNVQRIRDGGNVFVTTENVRYMTVGFYEFLFDRSLCGASLQTEIRNGVTIYALRDEHMRRAFLTRYMIFMSDELIDHIRRGSPHLPGVWIEDAKCQHPHSRRIIRKVARIIGVEAPEAVTCEQAWDILLTEAQKIVAAHMSKNRKATRK